jgi:hypothetical protein
MSGSNSLAIGSPPAVDPKTLVPNLGSDDAPGTSTPAAPRDDPEYQELLAARAAVEAEEAGTASAQPPAPAPAQATPAAPDPASPAPVPYARFAEVAAETRRLREELAFMQGQVAAMAQPQAPAGTPTAEPQTDPILVEAQAIEDGWMELARDYDAGSMTFVEFTEKQLPLLARIFKMHISTSEMVMRSEMAALQAAPGIVDKEVIRTHTAELERKHPWSTQMAAAELDALVAMANAEAAAKGQPYARGEAGSMRLRERVAELASQFMPVWRNGMAPTQAPAAAAPQPAPAQRGRPTQADVQTALARASNLPPNAPSNHGTSTGPVTLDRIDTMTDAEIEAMSPAERRRLLEAVVS